jgi:hypothetical protein
MVSLDRGSAAAHQKGLVKMLLAAPKNFRDDIGPLIAIIKMYVIIIKFRADRFINHISRVMISFACIFDMLPIWDCLYSESIRPNTLIRNLVSRATLSNTESIFEKGSVDAILDVYEAISRLGHLIQVDHCSTAAEVERVLSNAPTSDSMGTAEYNHPLSTHQRLNICCQLCCQIFWKILRRQSHREEIQYTTLNHEVRQLLKHLAQIEPLYWIRKAPEVFTWAAFTGAAASDHHDECVAFISRAGMVLAAIDREELTLIRQGWRYFHLLKKFGGDDNALAVLADHRLRA